MCPLILTILSPDKYYYGKVLLDNREVLNLNDFNQNEGKEVLKGKLNLDCVFVHYFIKELILSCIYRNNFLKFVNTSDVLPRNLILQETKRDLIDYRWNEHVCFLIREKCELDHALSWLSTLGGAFSALGDYFEKCADTAGKISVNQLKLAIRLGDPNIASRCRLYLSLSLIQKKKYKLAAKIIEAEYVTSKCAIIVDERLVRMCKGIWSKLQYEYSLYRKNKGLKS
ncbi:uncharacterized protein F58A4.6 [Sitophilus oryzae]|uniref:Uncharacterized protein F58A4.6 n=1 Tax=Sitophilus oryzae TaxID=7048 RepID=A0A6J2XWU1_SITOR|nr:uncharacterized protein F58A4.6 [Sitophilus oryzae]